MNYKEKCEYIAALKGMTAEEVHAKLQRAWTSALAGHPKPEPPPPTYESLLLTAGYEAEIRCERPA